MDSPSTISTMETNLTQITSCIVTSLLKIVMPYFSFAALLNYFKTLGWNISMTPSAGALYCAVLQAGWNITWSGHCIVLSSRTKCDNAEVFHCAVLQVEWDITQSGHCIVLSSKLSETSCSQDIALSCPQSWVRHHAVRTLHCAVL